MLGMIALTGATLDPSWPRSDAMSFCISMHIRAVCLGSTSSSREVSTSIPSITFIVVAPELSAGAEERLGTSVGHPSSSGRKALPSVLAPRSGRRCAVMP